MAKKITLFGATGSLGSECLKQLLDNGYSVTVLCRSPEKLPSELCEKLIIIKGNALNAPDIEQAISEDTDSVMFAIGVDRHSPQDLCTDVTRLIIHRMKQVNTPKLIWCGGGSNLLPEDIISPGARFVRFFSEIFLRLRHFDKEHQLNLLNKEKSIRWFGVRPLQMKPGKHTQQYRLGYARFSGLSSISFADCADAMINMIEDERWLHQAPIIQY